MVYLEALEMRDQWLEEGGILPIPPDRSPKVGGQDMVFAFLRARGEKARDGEVVVALDEAVGKAALGLCC